MTAAEFKQMVSAWLQSGEYRELFTRACCAHFAARAYRRGMGEPFFTESIFNRACKAHVFLIGPDGIGFDVNGFNDIGSLLHPVSAWSKATTRPMTIAEVFAEIEELGLGPDLDEAVFAAADSRIDELLTGS